jgi:two-component system KDP operon response regulator KdpE
MDEVRPLAGQGAKAFVTHTRDYDTASVIGALAHGGFSTTERPHDRDSVRLVAALSPDVILLAINPLLQSDLDLVRQMAALDAAAVIVLSPVHSPEAQSAALASGADLCLRDADGAEVLAAQVVALRRRLRLDPPAPSGDAIILVADLALDFDRCQTIRDGKVLPLTPTEFKILAHLARNAGRVISPVEILRAVQEYTYTEREAQEIVKVYIRRIRRKIEADPSEPRYVVNVRGFGYMLERQLRPAPDRDAAA